MSTIHIYGLAYTRFKKKILCKILHFKKLYTYVYMFGIVNGKHLFLATLRNHACEIHYGEFQSMNGRRKKRLRMRETMKRGKMLPDPSSFNVNLIESMQINVQSSHSHAHSQRFLRNHYADLCSRNAHAWMLSKGKLSSYEIKISSHSILKEIFGQSFNLVGFHAVSCW